MGVSNRWPSSISELISHMEMRLRAPVTRGYFFSPRRFAPRQRGFVAKYRSEKNILWNPGYFYGTPGDSTKLVLNLHSWKTIYLKIFALFLSSFWCTTFLFLSLRCNISSGGEKITRFLLFEFVLRVFFAEDFGIRIDEILLKRNFLNMLLLFLRRLRNRSE